MDTMAAILSRRSIRSYQPKPIAEEDLREIMEAGIHAPSAADLQPWYFVAVCEGEHMARLLEIMGQVSSRVEPALRERFSKHPQVARDTAVFIRQMGGAPVCVLAFQLKPEYSKTSSTIVQSVAAGLENIALAATSKGLGSCWLTAPIEAEMGAELREAFAPDKGELVAIMTLGYPAQEPKMPRRKENRYVILDNNTQGK